MPLRSAAASASDQSVLPSAVRTEPARHQINIYMDLPSRIARGLPSLGAHPGEPSLKDGVLAEFTGVANVFKCAQERTIVPGQPAQLRIMGNLGDVVTDGSGLFCDRDNLAEKIEALVGASLPQAATNSCFNKSHPRLCACDADQTPA